MTDRITSQSLLAPSLSPHSSLIETDDNIFRRHAPFRLRTEFNWSSLFDNLFTFTGERDELDIYSYHAPQYIHFNDGRIIVELFCSFILRQNPDIYRKIKSGEITHKHFKPVICDTFYASFGIKATVFKIENVFVESELIFFHILLSFDFNVEKPYQIVGKKFHKFLLGERQLLPTEAVIKECHLVGDMHVSVQLMEGIRL